MTDRVAIPIGSLGTPDHYHAVEDGEPQCHVGRRKDREFEPIPLDDLDPRTEPCTLCFGDANVYKGGGDGWASKLRSADDPEEVLSS